MNGELRDALLAAKSGDAGRARLILAEFLRQNPDHVPAWALLSKLAASEVQKAAFLRKILDIDPNHTYARQELEKLGEPSAPVTAVGPEFASVESDSADSADFAGEAPGLAADETFVEQAPAFAASSEKSSDERPFAEELESTEPAVDEVSIEEIFEEQGVEPIDFEEDHIVGEEEAVAERQSEWPVSDDPFDYEAQTDGDTIPPWIPADETLFETPPAAPPTKEVRDEVLEDLVFEDDEDLPDWLREEGEQQWLDEEEAALERSWQPSETEDAAASEKAARLSAAMSQAPQPGADDDSGRGWLLPVLLIVAAVVFLVLVYAVLTYLL